MKKTLVQYQSRSLSSCQAFQPEYIIVTFKSGIKSRKSKALKLMWVNLQSIGRNVFTSKKWSNKIILMIHGKPKLSYEFSHFHSSHTTNYSSVSRLFMHTNFRFGFNQVHALSSCLVSCRVYCLLDKLTIEFPVSMVACFSMHSKPCIQLMFSGLAFLNW